MTLISVLQLSQTEARKTLRAIVVTSALNTNSSNFTHTDSRRQRHAATVVQPQQFSVLLTLTSTLTMSLADGLRRGWPTWPVDISRGLRSLPCYQLLNIYSTIWWSDLWLFLDVYKRIMYWSNLHHNRKFVHLTGILMLYSNLGKINMFLSQSWLSHIIPIPTRNEWMNA